jgi:hypothetical protein
VKFDYRIKTKLAALVALALIVVFTSSRLRADSGMCGGATSTLPFTDIQGSIFFCSIAQAYFSGLTLGTSATTYGPNDLVNRGQMAAFITRTQDSSLRRGSRRAALDQWWTPQASISLATTQVGNIPLIVKSDGADLWVTNNGSDTVSRVRASDGKLLGSWTGVDEAVNVLVARGKIYITGSTSPGRLYSLDPTQPPGPVTLVSDDLGSFPVGIAFDGLRIWTANNGGNVSIVSFNQSCFPSCQSVNNVFAGLSGPNGMLYDGSSIWITDRDDATLKRLNSNGTIAQSIPIGTYPLHPIFDGTNIWVPNNSGNSVTVVRVKDAAGNPLAQPFVLATLTGNGLNEPFSAAFDGQRILISNSEGSSVSLWKAADLTPLGSFTTGLNTEPDGVCSDGVNFWITLRTTDRLARF